MSRQVLERRGLIERDIENAWLSSGAEPDPRREVLALGPANVASGRVGAPLLPLLPPVVLGWASACSPAGRAATLAATTDTACGHHTMLDRIKELGGQLTTSAVKVAGSMKDGADTVAAQAGDALQATRRKAADLGNSAGNAATREAVVQMRDMLALAAQELRARPIIDGPVTLTAKVDLMLTGLQMEFVLHPDTRVLHVPWSAAPGDASPGSPAVQITVQPAGPAAGQPGAEGADTPR